MPDDMHCLLCNRNVYSVDVESYSVWRWIPEEQRNVFVATYCSEHKPEG